MRHPGRPGKDMFLRLLTHEAIEAGGLDELKTKGKLDTPLRLILALYLSN